MRDPYLDFEWCYMRLKKEVDKYGTLYIAFDFDNTVFDFHNKGDVYPYVEHLLRQAKDVGFKLILFTGHDDADKLAEISEYCKERGYAPDYINESPIMPTRKPYYNLLLDDRAGLSDATKLLFRIIYYISNVHNRPNQAE